MKTYEETYPYEGNSKQKFEDPTQDRFTIIPKSSVEITRNAKGEPQWKIKVIPGEEKLLDGLMKQAVLVYRALEGEFK